MLTTSTPASRSFPAEHEAQRPHDSSASHDFSVEPSTWDYPGAEVTRLVRRNGPAVVTVDRVISLNLLRAAFPRCDTQRLVVYRRRMSRSTS